MNPFAPLPPWGMLSLFVLLGLLIGSFLNVLVTRLPIMMMRQRELECLPEEDPTAEAAGSRYDLFWPPSQCPSCHAAIQFRHNIPLLSWLWLRGVSPCCKMRISPRYPALELGGALLFVAAYYRHHENWVGAVAVAIAWSLMLGCGVLALERRWLAEAPLHVALWLGLLVNAGTAWYAPLDQAVLCTALAWAAAWLASARSADIAPGVVPLAALPAAWLGWVGLAIAAIAVVPAAGGRHCAKVSGALLCLLPALLWLLAG